MLLFSLLLKVVIDGEFLLSSDSPFHWHSVNDNRLLRLQDKII